MAIVTRPTARDPWRLSFFALTATGGISYDVPVMYTSPVSAVDVNRRQFLMSTGSGLAGSSAATASSAAGSLAAPDPPPAKLGLDLFGLRSQGWSAFQLLDYAAGLGVQIVHFSEPRFLGSLEDAHLEKVKARADELGLGIEVGFGSICPTSTRFDKSGGTPREQLLRMFGVAKKLGSPLVRCYLGSSNEREGPLPIEAHIENTIESCKSVRGEALDMGLMIAVENHAGDLQATQLKTLIEEAGKDYVGALIDPGNATWTLEDPLHTLEILAPYCVTTGVRDSAIWEVPSGAASQWVAMGEGNVNIGRWAKRFTELCPGKPFSLEIINLRTPRVFNYRESEFWKDYRDVPAWIFAGFENLARSGVEYSNVPAGPAGAASDSPEFKQFMIDQERRDVEQAVQYAKDVLRIGAG